MKKMLPEVKLWVYSRKKIIHKPCVSISVSDTGMLTCLEKTPQLDAVCSNFLAQELNISGDRNTVSRFISETNALQKITVTVKQAWCHSGWIWPRLFSCWWFEQPLVVTRWFRNSGETVRLTRCTNPPTEHAATSEHKRASGIYGCVYCRHTIKTRRKSF